MKLVSFSVENYRSITTARKIPLSQYSLLVGANNEGKSNILHALALAMDALVSWHRSVRRTPDGKVIRIAPSMVGRAFAGYDWNTDFPISKKNKIPDGTSNITLEFQLDDTEIFEFRSEIKSNLNGTLPILISFGQRGFDLSVQKPGRGFATLNKKSTRIADFVSRRIRFEYIPAIRTANSAEKVISELVDRELSTLESLEEYRSALDKIEELQQPIFDSLAETIHATVANFLPSVKTVRLNARRDARQRALRREVEILVNDGQETRLKRKGDGVQSLVALALMRHASEQSQVNASTVIAIEEPESHLHPSAIHELRAVIEELSAANQIVLSSHSPLFVNINNLSNTILVKESKAKPASSAGEIREALGVRFSDNLQNAALVVLVEGSDDARAVKALLCAHSAKIASSFADGLVTIDYLGGASSLSQKASFYKASACNIQCLLDDDAQGRTAIEKAMKNKSVSISDVNLCVVPHLNESEIEDLYDRAVYSDEFLATFGVDPRTKLKGNSKQKWSSSMEQRFRSAGKPWNDAIKAKVKNWLSEYAAQSPLTIVRPELFSPLSNFISSIEAKIPQ